MSMVRSVLLAGSQSRWLREQAPRFRFVRDTVSRFMPGEKVEDALEAAHDLQRKGLGTVFTALGENVTDKREAEAVAAHYVDVLRRIQLSGLGTEVSVKLTQLGLDLDPGLTYENLRRIIEAAGPASTVWIDMEASNYTDVTLELYKRARFAYPNVGVCLQAYLYRTRDDLESLIPMGPAIRLVKGAYKEPSSVAFPRKKDVDENYFKLAEVMLSDHARSRGMNAAFGTHDRKLIARIASHAESRGLPKSAFQFQMLYGIQRQEQLRLAREGWRSTVLIAYGSYWFPWFMRRLAERPANVWFVARNIFS
jgi:proline dehydrogenase